MVIEGTQPVYWRRVYRRGQAPKQSGKLLQGEVKMISLLRKFQVISLTVLVTTITVFGFGATVVSAAGT